MRKALLYSEQSSPEPQPSTTSLAQTSFPPREGPRSSKLAGGGGWRRGGAGPGGGANRGLSRPSRGASRPTSPAHIPPRPHLSPSPAPPRSSSRSFSGSEFRPSLASPPLQVRPLPPRSYSSSVPRSAAFSGSSSSSSTTLLHCIPNAPSGPTPARCASPSPRPALPTTPPPQPVPLQSALEGGHPCRDPMRGKPSPLSWEPRAPATAVPPRGRPNLVWLWK